MKDKILIINYDFPPVLAGVRRIVKFARYLPDHGFEPIVLTASPAPRAQWDADGDTELPSGIQVYRTSAPDLEHMPDLRNPIRETTRFIRSKFDRAAAKSGGHSPPGKALGQMALRTKQFLRRAISLPDDRFPWLATAIPMAEHILKTQAVRYVLTSSYPNSTHLIGLHLKHKFKIHWHADFRDGWMQNPYFADHLTGFHRRLNANLEQQVIQTADSISTVSEPIADYLAERTERRKVSLIPNGFDPGDLDEIPVIEFDKFTLAYTGTLFMQRSPDSFFAAVRGLLDSYPGLKDNFQVIFRSLFKPEHQAMINDLGLKDTIINWGMGTWKEALSLQKSADALLVLEGESSNSHIMLTQKVFEYLAAKKPILAVAPPGALSQLVRSTKSGVVVHPEDVFRLKETLFELFLGRMTFPRMEEQIRLYTRQEQTRMLTRALRGNVYGQLR